LVGNAEKFREMMLKEEKETRKKEKSKKRQGRIEVEKAPDTRYESKAVDEIVSKMKKRYEERGYRGEQEKGKGAELRRMVTGVKAFALDTRSASELRTSKKFIEKITGILYSKIKFFEKVTSKLGYMSVAENLAHDLDSADKNISVRQYVSVSFVAAMFVTLFSFVLLMPIIYMMVLPMMDLQPLGISIAKLGLDMEMVPTALQLIEVIIVLILSAILSLLAFGMSILLAFKFPSNTAAQRGKKIDKDLPFALRHMATEIRAGIGIHATMKSIVEADYGLLSREFERTLNDIDKGVSTEDALTQLSNRTPSEALSRATLHIIRALRTGGNLSAIIESIAKDVSFDLTMKMREFVEKLNLIGLFYMMIGIVFPVFVAVLGGIFNAIPTIGMAGMLGAEVLFLIYFILIPMALGLILYVIKVMQPM